MSNTLILCPGLLCDAALWRSVVDGLSGLATVQVADFTSQESISAMAETVLENAPDRFALGGLSMGGYVAQEVMRRSPERVTRLALLDTSARKDGAAQSLRRKDLIALAGRGRFRGVTPSLMPLLVHPDRLEDAALTDEIQDMAERVGADAFLRQQTAILGRVDGREDLKRIHCPTLVLCGREDQLTPLDAHIEMAESIAGADLVVLGNCGHMSTMERPADVTAAMRAWLER
jgi:pimeloyl-ACP methyl ester carboxylesterase